MTRSTNRSTLDALSYHHPATVRTSPDGHSIHPTDGPALIKPTVFKRIGDPTLINALSWAFRLSALWIVLDHPVYIPRPALAALSPRPYRETACTVQGMARVRSGQAVARSASCHWPVSRPFTRLLWEPVRV